MSFQQHQPKSPCQPRTPDDDFNEAFEEQVRYNHREKEIKARNAVIFDEWTKYIAEREKQGPVPPVIRGQMEMAFRRGWHTALEKGT